jgi:hypothetical protein
MEMMRDNLAILGTLRRGTLLACFSNAIRTGQLKTYLASREAKGASDRTYISWPRRKTAEPTSNKAAFG